LLTKPLEKGGLGFGTIGSSMILAILLIGFVVYASIQERRTSANAALPLA
jgi:uncharacterized membrane-anchored protein